MFANSQIQLDELPQYQEVEFAAISGKHLTKSLFQRVQVFVVLLLVLIGFMYFLINWFLAIPIFSVSVLLFVFWCWNAVKKQPKYGYALREKDILYRRGFLVNKITVVPFCRIQHVSVTRGVLDKFLGIANLKLFTAGGTGSDIHIPGLTPELAKQLKEAVSQKISSDAEESI